MRASRGNGAVISPVLLRKLNSVACQVRYAKLILCQDLGVFKLLSIVCALGF